MILTNLLLHRRDFFRERWRLAGEFIQITRRRDAGAPKPFANAKLMGPALLEERPAMMELAKKLYQ